LADADGTLGIDGEHRIWLVALEEAGGSLGGLFAGNLPRRIDWDVEIFERSPPRDLDSRGGGIVLQPEVVEVFRQASVDIRAIDLGVRPSIGLFFGWLEALRRGADNYGDSYDKHHQCYR
jgi:hypothetical protein